MHTLSELPQGTMGHDRCLLRVDWNVENPAEAYRVTATLPTLRAILKKGYRVIIISHRGRPQKASRAYSLKPMAPLLERMLKRKVAFIPHAPIETVATKVQNNPSSLILLENIRFYKEEHAGDPRFGKTLASLGDVFVNDAFSVAHRSEASITEVPKLLPSYAGLLLEKEVETLTRAFKASERPLVLVVGGAKVPEKLHFIERFVSDAKAILVGGVVANTFLKAQGKEIGTSIYEEKMIPLARKLLTHAHIILPTDFIMKGDYIKDIGPISVDTFHEYLKDAKTIIWNGPMGVFEEKRYAGGTFAIARAIQKSNAFTIAGGGETAEIIQMLKLSKKIGFLSTGGGAMLEFLIQGSLPGIEALN